MYILIILSVIAASLNSTLLHKSGISSQRDTFLFNLISSFVWIALLSAANMRLPIINRGVLFWGTVYGVIQTMFLVFKLNAMSGGEVSVTTLIGNCSLLMSTALSVMIWQESISIGQIIGIALLLIAVFICTNAKNNGECTKNWKWYCIAFFVCASFVGIIFKAFSKSDYSKYASDMMIVSAFVICVLLFVLLLLSSIRNKNDDVGKPSGQFVVTALVCGALSCGYNRLNIVLSANLPGAVFFPVFNGGVIVLSGILSRVILKERLLKKKVLGLMLGTAAIVIVGIF